MVARRTLRGLSEPRTTMGTSTIRRRAWRHTLGARRNVRRCAPIAGRRPQPHRLYRAGLDEAAIAEVFVEHEAALVGCEERHATTADFNPTVKFAIAPGGAATIEEQSDTIRRAASPRPLRPGPSRTPRPRRRSRFSARCRCTATPSRRTRPTPTVLGWPSGDLDAAALADALRAERRAIRLCWEREAIKNPRLEGKLWFGFDITTDGTVDALQVTEDTVATQPSQRASAPSSSR